MRPVPVAGLALATLAACGAFSEGSRSNQPGNDDRDAALDAPTSDLEGGTVDVDANGALDGAADTDADGNDKEHVVFVTDREVTAAELAGTKADDVCNAEAENATGLATKSFVAWLSTSTKDARDRITKSSKPYRTITGVVIADNYAALVSGVLKSPITVTSKSVDLGIDDTSNVWTGTKADGTRTTDTCSDWTSLTGQATFGEVKWTNAGWTDQGSDACESANRIYCFEK